MTVIEGTLLKDTYVIERELGRGGMGVVWEARHRSLDNLVCVKVLHRHVATNAQSMARFEREAKAMARIDSPHVVRVLDYGVSDDDEPFIVMERLVGADLDQVLEGRGRLSLDEVDRMLRHLDRALGWAHAEGIVHRDIKLANIFVLSDHDELFIKLLDFGLAKVATEHDLELTASASFMGTPYYMSPEQFVDPRDIDHRSDLWSIAIVAYACITGTLPFDGKTVGALSLAVHKGDFPAPSTLVPTLPRALDAFFERALAVLPEDRYESTAALREAFQVAAAMSLSTSQDRPRTIIGTGPTSGPPIDSGRTVAHDHEESFGDTVHADSIDPDDGEAEPPTEEASEEEEPPSEDRPADSMPASSSTAHEAPPVTADEVESASPARPRWGLVGVAAAVLLAGAGAWLTRGDAAPAAATAAPSATPTPSTTAAAPASGTVEARLAVRPPGAEVRVDGTLTSLEGGKLVLRGQPGTAFEVLVSHEGREHTESVVLSRQGGASVDAVELASAPAAAPSISAAAPTAPAVPVTSTPRPPPSDPPPAPPQKPTAAPPQKPTAAPPAPAPAPPPPPNDAPPMRRTW